KLALPHRDRLVLAQATHVVTIEVRLEVATKHRIDQAAVADAQNLDVYALGVDGDDRNALLTGARQHIGLAGKANEWLPIAHIDRERGRLLQCLPHSRRQAGAQGHVIALAVLEALDAELLLIGRHRRLVDTTERNEG